MTASPMSTVLAQPPAVAGRGSLRRIYAIRGLVALLWAAGFAGVSGSLDSAAIAFVVGYPVIDVVASLLDVRANRETSAGAVQLFNAGLSSLAVVGLAVASDDSIAAVLHVFGIWATVSGLLQLGVAWRRRRQLGRQWAMIVSGALSTAAGASFNIAATSDRPSLTMLSGYAALGGVLFLVSAKTTRGLRR